MATRNLFNLDPFIYSTQLEQERRQLDDARERAMRSGESMPSFREAVEPGLLLVYRGMFSQMYQEELAEQKKLHGKNWSPRLKLPQRSRPVLPKHWAAAFNMLTASMFRSGRILKPKIGEPILPDRLGKKKLKEWFATDAQRTRTDAILFRMSDHAVQVREKIEARARLGG